jgi:hypothetical protein
LLIFSFKAATILLNCCSPISSWPEIARISEHNTDFPGKIKGVAYLLLLGSIRARAVLPDGSDPDRRRVDRDGIGGGKTKRAFSDTVFDGKGWLIIHQPECGGIGDRTGNIGYACLRGAVLLLDLILAAAIIIVIVQGAARHAECRGDVQVVVQKGKTMFEVEEAFNVSF